MRNSNYDDVINNLIKEQMRMKEEISRLAAQKPLFNVLNVNSPSSFGTSQNNYDPGDYDMLLLTPTAAVNLTGISGGQVGRVLVLQNLGSFNLTLVHQSASSDVTNRFSCPGAVNHIMTPNATGTNNRVMLIYNQSRWCVMFESDAT